MVEVLGFVALGASHGVILCFCCLLFFVTVAMRVCYCWYIGSVSWRFSYTLVGWYHTISTSEYPSRRTEVAGCSDDHGD